MLVIYLKKTDYDTRVGEIEKKLADNKHDEYITTKEFNKLKLAQADLVTKTDFNNKPTSLDSKIVSNKTRHLLNKIEIEKLF